MSLADIETAWLYDDANEAFHTDELQKLEAEWEEWLDQAEERIESYTR